MSGFTRSFRGLLAGASAAAMLTATGSAVAQDNPIGAAITLDEVTVVISKTEETPTDALAAVSVVNEQRLEQLQATVPAEIFFGMPGVVAASQHNGNNTSINIRGLQDFGRVAVIVDGARQNFNRSQHGSQSNFWIEPELLKRVTVVRGPVSNIYGSGAIGGVVVFETISPSDFLRPGETWATALKSGFETNGDGWLVSKTAALRVSPGFEVIGSLVKRQRDKYEDGAGRTIAGTDFDVLAGFAKAVMKPADYHELTLGFIHNSNIWTEYTDADPSGSARDSDIVQNTYNAKYTIKDPKDPLIDFQASGYINTVELQQRQLVDVIFPPTIPVNLFPIQIATQGAMRGFDLKTVGFDIHNTSRFGRTFRHRLTYGGDWFKDNARTFDEDNASALTPGGERIADGLFIQDKIEYSHWFQAQLALRYDEYALDSPDVGVSTDGSRLSPRATVAVSPFEKTRLKGIRAYATYAEGYRAPSVTETLVSGLHPYPQFPILPNPLLSPEISAMKEIGLNLKRDDIFKPGDRFRGKVAWFQNDVEDYIDIQAIGEDTITFPFGPFGPPLLAFAPFQYVNIPHARIRGLEAEATYDAGGYFAGVRGHRLRGDNVETGLPLLTIPADQITTTLGVRLLNRKLTVGGELQFVAAQDRMPPLDPDDFPQPTDGYTLLNLFAKYEATKWLEFNGRINNVTDVNYRVFPEIVNSEGINAKIAATIRFGGG